MTGRGVPRRRVSRRIGDAARAIQRMHVRAILIAAVAVAIASAAWRAAFLLGGSVPPAPAFADVRAAYHASDLVLLDRHGEAIQEVRTDPHRRQLAWTPLAEISPSLTAAVLASEDRRFFAHRGVDWRAVAAAALEPLRGRPRRGASTITMQLATFLDPTLARRGGPRTLAQKWRQMRLGWRIEARWTKPEILEAYLNLASFRGELEGAAAASGVLFGKAPHGLTSEEGAVLAVLLRAPNAGPDAVARRAQTLLDAARDGGQRRLPSAPEIDGRTARPSAERRPSAEPRPSAEARPSAQGALMTAVAQALETPVGAGPRVALAPHAARRLMTGDRPIAVVRSTLDAELQRFAAESLRRHLAAVRDQHVQDGAVLVVDSESGDVLAYVGGNGEQGSARYVDGIRARRQAGSTLKPFLYGMALDQRILTAASLVEDTPLDIAVTGGVYQPRNYDERFKGLVSVRTALGSSLNVPAVRTLGLVGEEAALAQLKRLGFDGLVEAGDFYGPSMALGSVDVSLWELVDAYRALARGGLWSSSRLGANDSSGPDRRVYSERAAYLVSSILSDRAGRAVTFGFENPLATRFWTAVKTGTSKEMRDNWCVGYSRRYTVGVWVGNFSGEPMRNVSGVTGAAPVWAEVMARLHREAPSAAPAPPPGLVRSAVAFTGGVESDRVEWFIAGTEPRSATVGVTAGLPRIIAPVSGTIVALDPDIPVGRQRLVFEASGVRDSLRWRIDDEDAGSARSLVVWRPVRGRHTLALVDAESRVADEISFVVRGADLSIPSADSD